MSSIHSGKLKKIDLGEKSLEDFSKEICESNGIMKISPFNSNKKLPWLSTMIDYTSSVTNEKYFYHKDTLYELVDHLEWDDEDYFMKLSKNPDGTIGFFGQFYNDIFGQGTCLEEMLEEALDKFESD